MFGLGRGKDKGNQRRKIRSDNRNGSQRLKDKMKSLIGQDEAVPIFHGSDCEIRPEQFDFNMAESESDFGKAAYFGFKFNRANEWARHDDDTGVVNCYAFSIKDALNDDEITIRTFEDQLDWLDTILMIYDGPDCDMYDIYIGETMDGHTNWVMGKYKKLARSKGIRMVDLDLETKMDMLKKLKPNRYGLQMAIKNEKGLRHVRFITSAKARDMVDVDIDLADISGEVALMISHERGISKNDALVLFMESDTFQRLISEPGLMNLGASNILSMYNEEVSGHGL